MYDRIAHKNPAWPTVVELSQLVDQKSELQLGDQSLSLRGRQRETQLP